MCKFGKEGESGEDERLEVTLEGWATGKGVALWRPVSDRQGSFH